MQPYRRATIIGCVVLLFLGIWYYLAASDRLYSRQYDTLAFLRPSRNELSIELSSSIIYSRRCIKPRFSSTVDRQAIVNISEPLIGTDQVTLHLDEKESPAKSLPKCTPIELSVPSPYNARRKYPDLIFGMATTYDRLSEALSSIAHWCSGGGSKLIVIVDDWDDGNAHQVLQLLQEYRESGIEAEFTRRLQKSHTTSQSHFMVLTKMVEESGDETKWFGLLDDDTFFPHLQPLSDALGRLDNTADMYVGALAEDFGSIQNFGLMAYGGAGAYLSAHLARKLGGPEQAEACIREATPDFGDVILRDCVYHHSKAKFTWLPGLYQQDMVGDMSGFFESGVEPLNIHHWKSWYHIPVVSMATAANFCGGCFLQRWRFGGDTVFSNGYSIVKYRNGVKNLDLDKMERTFGQVYGDKDPQYDFTIGPLREKVGDDEKKSYKLVDTRITNGVMQQLYIWKGDQEAGVLDEVIELVWER